MREKGASGGTYMRKGAGGWISSEEVFPLVEFAMADFVGGIVLYTAEELIGPAVRWGLKPY